MERDDIFNELKKQYYLKPQNRTAFHMAATLGWHKIKSLHRGLPDLCYIYNETPDYYVGYWVSRPYFSDVLFPKRTTFDLTPQQVYSNGIIHFGTIGSQRIKYLKRNPLLWKHPDDVNTEKKEVAEPSSQPIKPNPGYRPKHKSEPKNIRRSFIQPENNPILTETISSLDHLPSTLVDGQPTEIPVPKIEITDPFFGMNPPTPGHIFKSGDRIQHIPTGMLGSVFKSYGRFISATMDDHSQWEGTIYAVKLVE